MDLNVDNVLNPNDIVDAGATKDVVENEVESVKQLVASNKLRQSTRDKRPSIWYPSNEYGFLTDAGEPRSFEEVLEDENKKARGISYLF